MKSVDTTTRIAAILAKCQFPGLAFHLGRDGPRPYLQVQCEVRDRLTGQPKAWSGRKWNLSQHMTKSEIVQTAFLAVKTFVEHETRESFTYDGFSIFDPHYDVDRLVALRKSPGALDVREDKRALAA